MSGEKSRSGRRRFTVDTLFTDTSARGIGVSDLPEARTIEIERIQPDPFQPRRSFDDERLEELAASIRAEGVLQPIAVRWDEITEVWIILHGERRWRAARIAGLQAVPAIVRDVPEERRLVQQLMENIVREDLNALDRAAALRALKERMGNPAWESVAEVVGIRRSRLFQLLGTEKLEPPLQEALRRGLVSEKQTRSLHGIQAGIQAELGRRILEGTLDPREIDDAVHELQANAPTARPSRRPAGRTALRQAKALGSTLDEIDCAGLDPRTANTLSAELRALQEQIAAVLDQLPN